MFAILGKRINIQEQAAKQKLLDERHWLIQEAFKVDPRFKAPSEYRPTQTKLTRKIYIPYKEYSLTYYILFLKLLFKIDTPSTLV